MFCFAQTMSTNSVQMCFCFTSKAFFPITGNSTKSICCVILLFMTMANRERPPAIIPDSFTEVPLQVGTLFPSESLCDGLVSGRSELTFSLLQDMLTLPSYNVVKRKSTQLLTSQCDMPHAQGSGPIVMSLAEYGLQFQSPSFFSYGESFLKGTVACSVSSCDTLNFFLLSADIFLYV